ncbi:MAG: hypothetical protein LC136_09165 [Burkholderiales bacterium]|nr:hypothetical protein [Burkholderiales bacterium]
MKQSVTVDTPVTVEMILHDCDAQTVVRHLREAGLNDWAMDVANTWFRIDDNDPDSGHDATVAVKSVKDIAQLYAAVMGIKGGGRPSNIYLQMLLGDQNEAIYGSGHLGWLVESGKTENSGYIRIRPEVFASALTEACERARDTLDDALRFKAPPAASNAEAETK